MKVLLDKIHPLTIYHQRQDKLGWRVLQPDKWGGKNCIATFKTRKNARLFISAISGKL